MIANPIISASVIQIIFYNSAGEFSHQNQITRAIANVATVRKYSLYKNGCIY
jgi:hypothetical protein